MYYFQGHDTTALALTFGLMLLADHEDVQVFTCYFYFVHFINVLHNEVLTLSKVQVAIHEIFEISFLFYSTAPEGGPDCLNFTMSFLF